MKIAVVTPYFPVKGEPHRGHSTFQTLLRLKKWAEIKAFVPMTRYPSWFKPKSFSSPRKDPSFTPPEIPAIYFEYPAVPGLTRAINGRVCAHFLDRLLSEYKPDLILNYWVYPDGYAAVKIGRKYSIPVIVGAIGSDLNRIPDWITERYIKQTLRESSFVITVSEHLRKRAIELGAKPESSRAIINGADTSIFRLLDKKEARVALGVAPDAELILYVGRLDFKKGLNELIRATANLAQQRKRIKLVYLGAGPDKEQFEQLAASVRIDSALFFAGIQDSPSVAKWMGAADVFALPSYAEGCPNVVVEALSCGRPVVATNVGGIPELVDERCGVLVKPKQVEELTSALETVLSRQWSYESIASVFRRSWEQVAEETLRVCESVLPKRRASRPDN